MELIINNIYQIKKSHIEKIKHKHYKIMPHIHGCGNKFRLVSLSRGIMECVTCKHRYTSIALFSDIYEPVKSNNPNDLFKRKQNVS